MGQMEPAAARRMADGLWSAMAVEPDEMPPSTGVRALWRTSVYQPLERASRRRILAHRSPEPFLSLRCATQAASGDGWRRSERRFQGVMGGEASEREYRMLVDGEVQAPLIMVAGYPRSGTTSLQTVVRAAFRHHIPELDTAEDRFSLWEYPKHTPTAIASLASGGGSDAAVVCAVRSFVDCAASLVVGRGGTHLVDVAEEQARWEAWLGLYAISNVHVIAFETIRASTPLALAGLVARLTGSEPEESISPDDTFAGLMHALGKGDPDSPQQSNLPAPRRAQALADARTWVLEQIGLETAARLAADYSAIPFSIDPAGTEDPR